MNTKVNNTDTPLTGASLFSSAGIAECYLKDTGINICVANEILPERAELYKYQYPETNMVCGDIMDDNVFREIVDSCPEKIDFLIASPPCQGMSVAGKNRSMEMMLKDKRNFLVFRIIEFIKIKNPEFIIIENVPTFLKIRLPYEGKQCLVTEILSESFSDEYIIESDIYDAADYGVPQRRLRAIIKMYRKGRIWSKPEKCRQKTLEEAIGYLPGLEAGECSDIKWHFARKHKESQIECMKHTPTGKSAFENAVFYPRKASGERIKAYNTTYRRMKWNEPAPTITMRNDAISSQLNVHPGRLLEDGTYSDSRVLTPLELMILSSLPADWNIPDTTPEILIRQCIGECIPPLLIKKIVSQIR